MKILSKTVSAVLDEHTCSTCRASDGMDATDLDVYSFSERIIAKCENEKCRCSVCFLTETDG